MASLTNNKIKDTYQSLVKFNDNGNITTSAKRLTDGFGNNSPFFVSTTQIGIGVTPTLGYDLHVNSNAKIGGNLLVSGNLTVSGTLTYLDVEDLATEDPLIKLARNNVGNSLDIGFFGKYVESTVTKYKGLFNDADDNKWKLFIGTSDEPTTIVNTSGTGYTVGTLVANIEGTTGTFSGLLKADTLTLTSGNDDLTFTQSSDDWTINNEQQNNGITIYDGTGGIDIKYAGTSYLDIDVNGVSVAGNIDFSVDTDTLYVDSTNENVGINSTGNTDYSLYVNGKIASNNYIIASLGNGGVALTHNDGYGNANVAFNHVSGIPEQNGNSFRIECNTDSSTNPAMMFELVAGVTSGVAVSTVEKMRLDETGVKVRDTAGGIIHLERDDTSIVDGNPLGRLRFTGDDPVSGTFNFGAEIRGVAAGTWGTDNYPSKLRFYTATTDTLNLALTLDESQNATFGGDIDVNSFVEIGEDGTYPTNYGAVGFGGRTNGFPRIFGGLSNKHIYITSGTSGDIKLRVNGGSTNVWTINTSGHLIPDTDIDIGDSSNRVREIYTTNIDISGTLKDSDGDAGTSGQVLSSTGTGTNWIDFEADSAKSLQIDVKNVHGATLAKGTVVHAEPTGLLSGNVIEVVAADANSGRMPAIGVLNEALLDDGEGKAVMFGTVQGIDTSAFSVGDELYVSATAGDLTATKPTATTEEVQKIAIVVKSHASNGLIKVFGAGRANDVPNLLTRNITIDGADFYFGNTDQIRMGDSVGLRIQHTGNHSYFDGEIGDMYFRAEADDSDMAFQADSGDGGNITYFRLDGGLATHDGTNTTQTVTVFPDNSKIQLGDDTAGAFRLFHNGTNSFIANNTGNIEIINYSDEKDIIFKSDNGSGDVIEYFRIDGSTNTIPFGRSPHITDNVKLYFGNDTANDASIKWDSTASQLFIDGETKFLNDVYFTSNAYFGDNDKLYFGDLTTPDLEIYHDGSNSYITDSGTGDLYIQGSDDIYITAANGEKFITCNTDGSVEIRYDNVKKFETTANGATIISPTNLVSQSTVLRIENNSNTGSSEDILLTNPFDRDVGIKLQTLGGYHHIWQDSNGDDSLIISAAGIASTDITMEFYQNHNVEIPNGNLTISGGDLVLDDGTTESPHIILVDDDDVEFRIYNADSNSFHITRSGNSGADFVINANASDYTQTTFNFAGATLSAATIGNWNTAYNDHIAGISFTTGDGVLTLTQKDGGILQQDLDGRYPVFRGNVLTLSNGEIADLSAAYQMTIDANDSDSDITNLGDFSGGYPFGIYFLGDGGNTGTTLGTGLVKVWNTGHFAKQNILDWETAYDDKINSASFETTDGVLTLTRQDAGTVTVDLDGRYLELGGGTMTGNLQIENSGTPTLTLDDTGNGNGGGASGKIIYANNDGNAIGLGYTGDITATSDFIISTDASSTYGGYLGLDSNAIADPSDIILDPKTKLLVTKNATFDGDILPITNSSKDLGSTSLRWANIYAVGGSFTNPVTIYDVDATENPRLSLGRQAAESLQFDLNDVTATIRHKQDADSNTAHYFDFIIDSSSTGNKVYRFKQDGNTSSTYLTINNTSATFAGTIASDNIAVTSAGNGEVSITRTSGATIKNIAQAARGQIGTSSNHELQLITNSTARLTINTSGNATFAGKILVGTGATAAASLNAYTQTVSTNLYSALRIIENSGASSYWDIGATGGGSPDLNFYVNAGTTPKFTINSSGDATFAGDVRISDSGRLQCGASYDLQIYHDGSDSWVRDTNTGNLYIDTNGTHISLITDGTSSTPMARFYKDAAVELYYNNTKKFETTDTGFQFFGTIDYTNSNFENTIVGGSNAPYVYQDMREYMQEKGHYADSAWIVKPNQDTSNHEVAAYQNNTNVFVDDKWIATIDRMERYQIDASLLSDFSKVTADKPIVCHKVDPDTVLMNTSFSGTILGGFATRYYPVSFAIYSPFGKTDIAIYRSTVQTGVDISGTPILTATLGAEQGTTLTESTPTTDTYYYVLVSDLPVTAAFTPSGGDNTLMAPIGMEVLGNDECTNSFGIDNGTLTSSITNKTFSEARLARDTTGKLGCFMYGTADGSGGDAEYGIPIERLSDNYIFCHNDISNFRLVSYKANKIQVLDKDDNVLYSIDHSAATKNVPLSHQEGTSSGAGSTLSTNGPFNFVGSAPFHLVCQTSTGADECVMLGAMNNKITDTKSFNGGQITNGLHLLPFGGNQLTELTLQGSSNQIEFIDNDVSSHRAKISSELGNLLFEVDLQQASASTAIEFKMDGGTALSFDANKDATFEGDVTFNGSVSYSSIGTTAGYTVSNTNRDSSSNPEGSGAEAIRLEHPNYTSGTYVHEFAKIQRVSGVPLYLRQTYGSTTFSNIIRFGSHSLSAYEFEVFGEGKMNRLALGSDDTALNASGVPEYPLYIVENTAGAAWIADQDSATDPTTNAPTLTLQNLNNTNNNWSGINFVDAGGDVAVGTYSQVTNQANHYGKYKIYTRGADGYNERISIDSGSVNIGSGMPQHKLEVYTNGTKYAGSFDYSGTSGTVGVMKFRLGGGSTSPSYVDFIYGSTQTGAITTNGTSTIYLTSSDYRLKENVVELNGALDRIDNLQPKRFNFISDSETTVDGFIAHEVADVVPEAVRGEKDAVNEDGDIIPQGIDQSKLVPLLVAAVKELRAEVELLKSQINS